MKPYQVPNTIHDNEEGDSPIYLGIQFLGIIAAQINQIRLAAINALRSPEFLWDWLNQIKALYDLVENRTGLNSSEEMVEVFQYVFNAETNLLERKTIKVKEKDKYEFMFSEITKMLERNYSVNVVGGNPYLEKKYLNNKNITTELSRCQRELMRDANKRHLIMPEGVKDLKSSIRNEWVDREFTKDF